MTRGSNGKKLRPVSQKGQSVACVKKTRSKRGDFVALPLPCQQETGVCSVMFCDQDHSGDCMSCGINHIGKCMKGWKLLFPEVCEPVLGSKLTYVKISPKSLVPAVADDSKAPMAIPTPKVVLPQIALPIAPIVDEPEDQDMPPLERDSIAAAALEKEEEVEPVPVPIAPEEKEAKVEDRQARAAPARRILELRPLSTEVMRKYIGTKPKGFDLLQKNKWPAWLPSPASIAAGFSSFLVYNATQGGTLKKFFSAMAVGTIIRAGVALADVWCRKGYSLSNQVTQFSSMRVMSEVVEDAILEPELTMPKPMISVVDFLLGKPVIRVGRVQIIHEGLIEHGDEDVRSFAANTTDLHKQNLEACVFQRFDALTGSTQKHFVLNHTVDACKSCTDLIPLDDLQSTVNRRLSNLTSLNLTPDQFAKNGFGVAQYIRDWQNNKMISSTYQAPRLNFDGGMALCFLGMVTCSVTFPGLCYQISMIPLALTGGLIRVCSQAYMSCKWLWVPP